MLINLIKKIDQYHACFCDIICFNQHFEEYIDQSRKKNIDQSMDQLLYEYSNSIIYNIIMS